MWATVAVADPGGNHPGILMSGRDVVGLAQTGTGKTAAFAIPILSRLDASARKPQALIPRADT